MSNSVLAQEGLSAPNSFEKVFANQVVQTIYDFENQYPFSNDPIDTQFQFREFRKIWVRATPSQLERNLTVQEGSLIESVSAEILGLIDGDGEYMDRILGNIKLKRPGIWESIPDNIKVSPIHVQLSHAIQLMLQHAKSRWLAYSY